MKIEQIKDLLAAQPFRPFTIDLLNSSPANVQHKDYVWFLDDGRTLWVEAADGSAIMVDVLLVQSVRLSPGTATE
jgi:hypothetical protein